MVPEFAWVDYEGSLVGLLEIGAAGKLIGLEVFLVVREVVVDGIAACCVDLHEASGGVAFGHAGLTRV